MSAKPRVNRQALLAVFALSAIGFLIYRDLVAFEESGGVYSLNTLLAIAYAICGKWGVMVVYSLFAAFIIGASRYAGNRQQPKE